MTAAEIADLDPSRGAESTRAAGATPDLRSTAAAIEAYGWARNVQPLSPQHVDEVGKIAIVVKQLVVEHNMGESTNSSRCRGGNRVIEPVGIGSSLL